MTKTLTDNIIALYGEQGKKWLAELDNQLTHIATQLKIELHTPYPNLTYHYVAPATDSHRNTYVLKYGIPNNEFTSQVQALTSYSGNAAIRIVQHNIDAGWMLLEQCKPGMPLTQLQDDDQATIIATQIMQALFREPKKEHSFKSIDDWLARLFSATQSNIPTHLLTDAQAITNELLQSSSDPVLLHGDLHHDNILSAQRTPWLVIDPKGIVGEREYETGALLRNPLPVMATHRHLKKLTQRRIKIITEYSSLDPDRILLWAYVQTLLSACWYSDDGVSGDQLMIEIASQLRKLI